jgi:hypothetical protein
MTGTVRLHLAARLTCMAAVIGCLVSGTACLQHVGATVGAQGVASPNGAVMPVVSAEYAKILVVQARGGWAPWSGQGVVGGRLSVYLAGSANQPWMEQGEWVLSAGWAADSCLTTVDTAGGALEGCGLATGPYSKFLYGIHDFGEHIGPAHLLSVGLDVTPGLQFGPEFGPEVQVGLQLQYSWAYWSRKGQKWDKLPTRRQSPTSGRRIDPPAP